MNELWLLVVIPFTAVGYWYGKRAGILQEKIRQVERRIRENQ